MKIDRMRGLAAISLACLAFGPARAESVDAFYRGKTIDLVVGYSPGGSYDLYGRLVARFLGDRIPGKPKVIVRNMPGGGSRVATRYVYAIAPQDGTVIGTADQALPVEQAMGDKLINSDISKLQYIGSPTVDNNTVATWSASGVMTIDDAKSREVPIGTTGGSTTSTQYPKALNALVGTRFKIISGYPGGNDISLAMERGEVLGRGSNAWDSWKATRPDSIRDHKISILVQIGVSKAPDLDAPLMVDLARNDDDRAVMTLLSASTGIGRPFFVGRNVPRDRVEALREAFAAVMADKEFVAAAAEQRLGVAPVSGDALQTLVAEILATPPTVANRLRMIIDGSEPQTR